MTDAPSGPPHAYPSFTLAGSDVVISPLGVGTWA